MGIPLMVYGTDRVYAQISNRLRTKYHINLSDHISSMGRMHDNLQEGFWFTPVDSKQLIKELLSTGAFQHDDRYDRFHAIAASATLGEGYRELAETSIHCQISEHTVNMHVDYTGFMWRGPNGESLIGPDAVFHNLDELKWPELVTWVSKKNREAGRILERVHPTIPRSANLFVPQIGAQVQILRGYNLELTRQWGLTLDFRWGCHDHGCRRIESYSGLSFEFKMSR